MTGFTFNGTTSQSLGLLVTALNPYNSASRRVETIEIPYRNGNLIIDSGTYDNIMVSYEVSVIGNTKTTCDAVNEWLSGSQGYCILSDTVNTEFFRVGYFASSIEYVLTALYREGKATLNFDCFPQKYLNSNTTITRNATSTTTTAEGGTFSSHVYPLPIDLKGNTSQSGTPTPTSPQDVHKVSGDNSVVVCGKNMFRDFYTGSGTYRGVTKTGGDKCVILNGTYNQQGNYDLFFSRSTDSSGTANMTLLKANTTYAVSVYLLNDFTLTNISYFRISSRSLDGATFNWNYKTLDYANGVAQGTFTVGNTDLYLGGIRMALTSSISATFNNCIVKIQVEEANAVTPFEEYRGIDYNINLPVENLLNLSQVQIGKAWNETSNNARAVCYIQCLPSTKYTISFKDISAFDSIYNFEKATIDGTTATSGISQITATKTITTQSTSKYLGIQFNKTAISSSDFDNVQIQIERGSRANTYTPYGTTPIELNKIGSYQDYFFKSDVTGKWYVHKETKRIVVDENSQVWLERATSPYIFAMAVNDYKRTEENICVCDYFTSAVNGSYARMQNGEVKFRYYNDTQNRLYFCTADYSTLSAFNTWLSTHNVTVIYALRTATNTEITDATLLSQLNAIDNAMAFETSTTITQVNNDAPFLLTYTNIGSSNYSSNYRGEPIITVNDTGYIYINGASIKVNQVPMTINSQTMQAYNGNINLNNYIEINEFPMLKKGNNDIGSTMALSIVPNYWKL